MRPTQTTTSGIAEAIIQLGWLQLQVKFDTGPLVSAPWSGRPALMWQM